MTRPPLPPPGEIAPMAIRFGLAGAPVATAFVFLLNLFIVREACATHAVVSRFALIAFGGLVSAAAGAVSWRNWLAVRDTVPPAAGGQPGRNRFVAMLGLAASAAGVLLAIAWLGVELVLDRCTH